MLKHMFISREGVPIKSWTKIKTIMLWFDSAVMLQDGPEIRQKVWGNQTVMSIVYHVIFFSLPIILDMAIRVVEFSREGCKIRNIFG